MMVCLWCESLDDRWCAGGIEDPQRKDPDGSAGLFGLMVDPPPDAFQRWAEDCDEVPASLEGVRHVHVLRPLTQQVVSLLNAEAAVEDLTEDLLRRCIRSRV